MQNNNFNDRLTGSFSMRKIPVSVKTNNTEFPQDENIDKIKILELCNIIDKWEQEVLFSDNGFFSLKGKDVENKSKDFIKELEDFIGSKISEISFSNASSKEILSIIKKEKISSIQKEMLDYEQEQINEWQIQVYETALSFSISRAILYKSNPDIVLSSLKNGLCILNVMSEKEKWNSKTNKQKIDSYKSKFYSSVINSFVQDKDIKAYIYFNKFKDKLNLEEKEKLEYSVKQLKINVIAYNWAKELFSYKLSKDEQEAEIKKLKDDELEKCVRKCLADFSKSEVKEKEQKEKRKNIENWKEILNIINDDIDRAFLFIDYSLPFNSIKHKKEYIEQIKKNGCITTDRKQFLDLLKEFFEDFEKFKVKDISDFRYCLSQNDYDLFENFQKIETTKFLELNLDYKYIEKKLKKSGIKRMEDIYDFVSLLILSKEEYKTINKKDADLDNRNKLIDLVTERFKQNKKEGEKDDSIINSSGE